MGFEFFVAIRHLMSRERRALISIITTISILGVVVGVAALVAVIAVMDGADKVYLKQLIDVYAHLEIYKHDEVGENIVEMDNYRKVLKTLAEDPEVVAASPVLKRFAALKLQAGLTQTNSLYPAQILGVDPDLEGKVSRIGEENGGVVGSRIPHDGEIVVGNVLAQQIRKPLATPLQAQVNGKWVMITDAPLGIGDELYALTGRMAQTANGVVPKQSKLRVVGMFASGIYDIDKQVAYVSLATSQRMNLLDDVVDLVHVRLKDPNLADGAKKRIAAKLGPLYQVRTWGELNPEFFKALKLEKVAMFVILLLVIIVAALNIISTLILVTMEKTREIGVLRAMGTSRRSIRRIFLIEGGLIGVVGTVLGVGLGLVVCYFLKYHCPIELPEAVYGLNGLPVQVEVATVLEIMACSIGLSLLASVIPAIQAARLHIVEALRYE